MADNEYYKIEIMKKYFLLLVAILFISCASEDTQEPDRIQVVDPTDNETSGDTEMVIDFSDWKITLPVDVNNDGSPDEYTPSQLDNGSYRSLAALDGFMYDDEDGDGIIFHTQFFADGATTTNSSYPRTELRELINPSNSRENWNLASGGVLKMRMQVKEASNNTGTGSLSLDRFIIAQIHGIINPTDVSRLNLSSDAAPPLLKMQWRDGDLYAYKKTLVNDNTSGDALLDRSSTIWTDISHNFGPVGYDAFDLEIRASTGRIEVIVNGASHVFQDVSLAKWPFDSYFKAGTYMQTTDTAGYSTVKVYSLEVTH